ncbi:MAG: metallophosphoesterase family protein, partial [Desulfobacterales bacterium]
MRIAIISDIHGNMEAFDQVLRDIDNASVDKIISLGDNIGYGPDPEKVIRIIRKRKVFSILGNHEMAVADPTHLSWFNSIARESLRKTAEMLSSDSHKYISSLKSYLNRYKCRYVHGFPPDSPTIYAFQVSQRQLLETFFNLKEQLCFIGHTHYLQLLVFDGQAATAAPLCQGISVLSEGRRYIVNVGSVGQPRDGNNSAKYVIYDA